MTWVVWLLIPVAVTVLAAFGSWLRSRPKRAPTTAQAMQAHDDFLEALATLPRCPDSRSPRSSASPGDGPSPR